jgi:hypothetical protein
MTTVSEKIIPVLAGLVVPEGFTHTVVTKSVQLWKDKVEVVTHVVLSKGEFIGGVDLPFIKDANGVHITISYRPNEEVQTESRFALVASGHTRFQTAKGQMSFDRLGIEDSFYISADDSAADLNETIAAQLKRIEASRARLAISENIPVLGYSVTPERKAQVTAKLKAGKSETFYPSGMGTAHRIATRKTRYANPLPTSVAEFFGVAKLYVETLDHD